MSRDIDITWSKPEEVRRAVGVLVRSVDGLLLLGKRLGMDGAGCWGAPGGWMRHGESIMQAGARKLNQETGSALLPGVLEVLPFKTIARADGDLPEVELSWCAVDLSDSPSVAVQDPAKHSWWQWFDQEHGLPTPLSRGMRTLRDLLGPTDAWTKWRRP